MLAKKRTQAKHLNKTVAANRRRRMMANNKKKVIWRHRSFMQLLSS